MSHFYEKVAGSAGKELDNAMREWRHKGINGPPEEREQFLLQCFHGARGVTRVFLSAVALSGTGRSRKEILDTAVPKLLEVVSRDAKDAGFDDEQTQAYIDVHRRAYDSLAEELVSE